MWISAVGKLRFGNTNIVVDVDRQIGEYYYSLIPKYYWPQRQMYPSHITVVRSGRDVWPKCMKYLNGQDCEFEYENMIRFDGLYFFLQVQSERLGRIRQSLGLTYYAHIFNCFHITVGNIKHECSKT